MQYPITHTCGHTITHQLYGKGSERESRAAWLERQPCLQCKRDAELNAALNANQEAGLPALTGSEKQIAWAEQIRAKVITEFTGRFDRALARATDPAVAEQIAARRTAVFGWFAEQTDSRYWIDSRFETADERIAVVAKALMARGVSL